MHEEVNEKTIALSVKATKITADVLKKALQKFLFSQKNKAPDTYKGKQTLKQLMSQNTGISNIELTDGNIKSFDSVAKKYGIDYALKKDESENPPKYLIFFKGRDMDVMTSAFKEFLSNSTQQKEKPSILQRLTELKEKIKAMSPPTKARDKERER